MIQALETLGEKVPSIMKRMPPDSEGCLTLVASKTYLDKPFMALVRLAEGSIITSALEIPLPLRFLVLVFTPDPCQIIDHFQVGRGLSTLMSNEAFQQVCYLAKNHSEILSAINDFLDESIVLPPGDWARKNLLSITEIKKMRHRNEQRKIAKGDDSSAVDDTVEESADNLFKRSPYYFGGIYNDIKKRYPNYWSDIKDGLNFQTVAATIFIYFAALSGAIAFGGLYSEKTGHLIGIPETLITSSLTGIIFILFSGTPLIITGATGPVLIFDEALIKFSGDQIDFLAWRCWIGVWLFAISLLVAFFQGKEGIFRGGTQRSFREMHSNLDSLSSIAQLPKFCASVQVVYRVGHIFPPDRKVKFLGMCAY